MKTHEKLDRLKYSCAQDPTSSTFWISAYISTRIDASKQTWIGNLGTIYEYILISFLSRVPIHFNNEIRACPVSRLSY